jgi:hypothetical protein
MTEREDIDQLFRDTLHQQELPVNAQAMQEAIRMLDNEKNKRTAWRWSGAAILLLMLGMGVYFWYSTDNKKNNLGFSENGFQNTAFNAVDSVGKNIGSSDMKNSIQKEQEELTKKTSDITVEEHSYEKQKAILESEKTNNSNNKSQKVGMAENGEKPADIKTREGLIWAEGKKQYHTRSENQNKQIEQQSNNNSGKINIHEELPESIEMSALIPPIKTNEPAINDSDNDLQQNEISNNSDLQNENKNPELNKISPEYNIPSDTLISNHNATTTDDSIKADSDSTTNDSPREITPPPTVKGKWDIRLGGSYSYVTSKLSSADVLLKDYIEQRNNQEKPRFGYGFDLSLARNFGRSNLSFGLGYSKTGEDIHYSGKITEEQINSSTSWDYDQLTFMIIDGAPNGGVYVFDTTYVTLIDSTATTTTDTSYIESNNMALSAHNGRSQLAQISIPIGYSYRILQRAHSELYATGQIEGNYMINRKAYYLNTNRNDVVSISSLGGQRSFMLNGAIGIEWRKLFHRDKMYVLVNPGFRTNLFSWNSDFEHRYYMPYFRIGLGYRL